MSHHEILHPAPSPFGRVPLALLLGISILLPRALLAEEEPPPLVTDRPDQTESTSIVPKGSFQLEIGWSHDVDRDSEAETIGDDLGGALVRIGLSRLVELRLGWNGFATQDKRQGSVESRTDGVSDASLGAKFRIVTGKGRKPRIAVLTTVTVPVGADELTSDGYDPSLLFLFGHTLSDRIVLGYNAGIVFESDLDGEGEQRTLSTWAYTLAAGFSLSEKVGVFVEIFGSVPASAPGPSSASFDTGLGWLVRPNLQLDGRVGVGLNEGATDWFAGLGLSVRFPR